MSRTHLTRHTLLGTWTPRVNGLPAAVKRRRRRRTEKYEHAPPGIGTPRISNLPADAKEKRGPPPIRPIALRAEAVDGPPGTTALRGGALYPMDVIVNCLAETAEVDAMLDMTVPDFLAVINTVVIGTVGMTGNVGVKVLRFYFVHVSVVVIGHTLLEIVSMIGAKDGKLLEACIEFMGYDVCVGIADIMVQMVDAPDSNSVSVSVLCRRRLGSATSEEE